MVAEILNTSRKNQRIAREAANWAYSHRNWTYGDIYEAYDKPSYEKVKAWNYCKRVCERLGGWDLIISSKNTFQFSAVFTFIDPETGVICYGYITRDYDRFAEATA